MWGRGFPYLIFYAPQKLVIWNRSVLRIGIVRGVAVKVRIVGFLALLVISVYIFLWSATSSCNAPNKKQRKEPIASESHIYP